MGAPDSNGPENDVTPRLRHRPTSSFSDKAPLSHLRICVDLQGKVLSSFNTNKLREIIESATEQNLSYLSIVIDNGYENDGTSTDTLGERILRTVLNPEMFSESALLKVKCEVGRSERAKLLNGLVLASKAGLTVLSYEELANHVGRGEPPDLILYFGGNQAIGEANMWSGAYSEFQFMEMSWDDFGKEELAAVLDEFGKRERRFGGI